ncbi:MAG: 4-(cytidine 5'-diphospho)-2-C-methyl-D-erythritol kinase [Thermoleophilia bacterium]|nr:4-(cytidine 5'-diphospho)-2-C-methyl-D-erythritol kinase [Thermoleophilia bacterium]
MIGGADLDHEEQHDTLRVSVHAPAKLNLLLGVGARRGDGFHEVASIMQTLDLVDRIDVDIEAWESDEIDVLVEAPGVPGGDTLVTRAVTSLLERAGVGARVWVTIDKEIPIGAGLGGGSSDAAAAMRAVQSLLALDVPEPELHELAAAIGSDVPFFLLGPGSAAFATGRGELLELVDPITPSAWLLAFPNVHQSTAEVYARHDPSLVEPLPTSAGEARRLARSKDRRNDLAGPARAACPELDRLCTALADAGGHPLVCGSGATVATPIRSRDDRHAFEAVARNAVPGCWLRVAWTTS